MPKYFSGAGSELGTVSALPCPDFAALTAFLQAEPPLVPLTREEFLRLSLKERNHAKRVQYLTAATFLTSPSRRNSERAGVCHLLFLDIDDGADAVRLLTQGWDALSQFAHAVWHTASSSFAHPRLRVMVSAESIHGHKYAAAVRTIAELLGLPHVTHESMVPVQPMFFPTRFKDEEPNAPLFVSCLTDADTFRDLDIIGDTESAFTSSGEKETGGVADLAHLVSPIEGVTLDDAREMLEHLDPDCSMQEWIKVAAGLKHQFGEDGFDLWDEWSRKGQKYDEESETRYRWSTLKGQTKDRAPVTLRSAFKLAQARGWTNPTLTQRLQETTLAWLRAEERSAEELLDQGVARVAKVGPAVGALEKKILLMELKTAMHRRDLKLPLPDLRRAVHRLEVEAAKQTGIPPWARGLVYVTARNAFYRHTTERMFSPEVLDLLYGTPQVADEKPTRPRDYLMQTLGIPEVENLRYNPELGEKRIYREDGVPYVNTYRPTYAKPDRARADEAGEIFEAHLAHLIAEPEYRQTLIDFLAFHVQHPGKKIRWATLIQSAQGAGKTFLAVAMAAVLGRRNTMKVTASSVLEGKHNDWAYGRQLVVLEEVRVVGHNRHAVMDKLKPCISDDEISLHEKFESHRTVPNLSNYLMFTNHHDALAIQDEDRRYFVLASPLQHKADILTLGGTAYFEKLFGMIRDNAGGLRAWFEDWTISDNFKPDGRAPETKYLKDMADSAASPLTAATVQAIEDQPHPLVRKDLVSLGCLRGVLDTERLAMFSDQALAQVLRELGWKAEGRGMIDGARHRLWSKGLKGDALQKARERAELL